MTLYYQSCLRQPICLLNSFITRKLIRVFQIPALSIQHQQQWPTWNSNGGLSHSQVWTIRRVSLSFIYTTSAAVAHMKLKWWAEPFAGMNHRALSIQHQQRWPIWNSSGGLSHSQVWTIRRVGLSFIYTASAVVAHMKLKWWAEPFAGMNYSIQLKYTIEGVSKILVLLDQTYFPRLRLGNRSALGEPESC